MMLLVISVPKGDTLVIGGVCLLIYLLVFFRFIKVSFICRCPVWIDHIAQKELMGCKAEAPSRY